jgi:hypothetical protein
MTQSAGAPVAAGDVSVATDGLRVAFFGGRGGLGDGRPEQRQSASLKRVAVTGREGRGILLGLGGVENPVPAAGPDRTQRDGDRLVEQKEQCIPHARFPAIIESPMRSPASRTPKHLTNPAFQASSDISWPSGPNQQTSLMSVPRIARPWKNFRR